MNNVIMHETALWNQLKKHAESIERHSASYWEASRGAGYAMLELRDRYPSNIAFGHALLEHGFDFTRQHQAALMWLARLTDDAFNSLREIFPTAMHPQTLQDRSRETYGPDWGLRCPLNGQRQEAEDKTAETSESPLLPAETQNEGADSDVRSIPESPAQVPEPVKQTQRPARGAIVEHLDAETAHVLLGFYPYAHTRAVIGRIAKATAQRKNLKRLAELIRSGSLGLANAVKMTGAESNLPSARLLFANIPSSLATRSEFRPRDGEKFAKILDAADRYAALSRQIDAWKEQGMSRADTDRQAMKWWHAGDAEPPKEPLAQALPPLASPPETPTKVLDLSAFQRPAEPDWLQLVPEEAPIVVYGKQIWPPEPNCGYPSLSFRQVWALVQHWEDVDRIMEAEEAQKREPASPKGRARFVNYTADAERCEAEARGYRARALELEAVLRGGDG